MSGRFVRGLLLAAVFSFAFPFATASAAASADAQPTSFKVMDRY